MVSTTDLPNSLINNTLQKGILYNAIKREKRENKGSKTESLQSAV